MAKTKNFNSVNSCADDMLNKISECIATALKGLPSVSSAVVQSVNNDGTVNICFPPDVEHVFTKISNQTPFELSQGDSVEILLKDGTYSNCWIIAKHGAEDGSSNTQENATSIVELQKLTESLKNNIPIKTSQLTNDSGYVNMSQVNVQVEQILKNHKLI